MWQNQYHSEAFSSDINMHTFIDSKKITAGLDIISQLSIVSFIACRVSVYVGLLLSTN